MCIAVPFKIKEIKAENAVVELDGLTQKISIALTPGVQEGDWVLVHAGYAIHIVEEDDAQETIKLFKELSESYDR